MSQALWQALKAHHSTCDTTVAFESTLQRPSKLSTALMHNDCVLNTALAGLPGFAVAFKRFATQVLHSWILTAELLGLTAAVSFLPVLTSNFLP